MCRNRLTVLICLVLLTMPNGAQAAQLQLSWSGYFEALPSSGNPWNLSGDGNLFSTPDDGTPITVTIVVSDDVIDTSPQAGFAQYEIDSISVIVGGVAAFVESEALLIHENESNSSGGADDLSFIARITLFGEARWASAGVFLPDKMIDFPGSTGIDPFTTLESTMSFAPFTVVTGNGVGFTSPEGTQFSVTSVPLPASIYLFAAAVLALFRTTGSGPDWSSADRTWRV